MTDFEEYIPYAPVVFLVGDTYQIAFTATCPGLASVKIGERIITDSINGVIKSESKAHKITVPQKLLDSEKQYTVLFSRLEARECYWSKPDAPVTKTFDFTPLPEHNARIYMIADSHSAVDAPIAAAAAQKPDMLVLCGDIDLESSSMERLETTHKIANGVAGGHIPVVYTRGNHDVRGKCAEFLFDYVGTYREKSYFTFKAGEIFGIVLDAGEDKEDNRAELGGVADFNPFRMEQIDFLKEVLAEKAYESPEIKHKIVFCHIPFTNGTYMHEAHTTAIFCEWIKLLNQIGVEIMFSGHDHRLSRLAKGEHHGITETPEFETVVGGVWCDCPYVKDRWVGGEYTGQLIEVKNGKVISTFTDSKGNIHNY